MSINQVVLNAGISNAGFSAKRHKKTWEGFSVIALVFSGHAAVFAAISAKAPLEETVEPEPMMVSLVSDSQPARVELVAAKPRVVNTPVKRQAVAVPTPEPSPTPVAAEPKAESVPQLQPQQERVAEVAPAPSSAPAEPAAKEVAVESEPVYQPPRFGVAYLHNPSPEYPPLSLRLREQGKVILRVMVTPAGEPANIELDKSSGFERLDQAAMEAVKQWRFVPAKRGDQAVSAWVMVPLNFSVKG